MNRRQLQKLGVPPSCVPPAISAIQIAVSSGSEKNKGIKKKIQAVLADPATYLQDACFGPLAQALIDEQQFCRPGPVTYKTWGGPGIDPESHQQMQQACSVPVAVAGALMPDAHVGYGLPIGGVLACENAVIPYAVGVDIACRMKLSILDLSPQSICEESHRYSEALEQGTRFGVGSEHESRQSHPVMDRNWTITRITRERKDRAWKQLGTSGSGNHFVEFGLLTLEQKCAELGLDPGTYVALLSHSGSRGAGAAVCSTYSNIARARLPRRYEELGRLAWLELDTEPGQEYWSAMNLMGEYAAANHEVIHQLVTKWLGAQTIAGVENHHNFAWKENHGGRELVVHRKGATPAALGELGIIPGSMADPAFVVRGRGQPESLRSASHGAGRRMSRTKARDLFRWGAVRSELAQQGVHVLSAGADEVPGAYKDIRQVMQHQTDLVEILARFDPRIVKMCGDGSRAED